MGITNIIHAQARKGEFIKATIGFGYSVPYDDIEIDGSGFYAQGEYILGLSKWFSIRPYVGFISTSPDQNSREETNPEYKVTAKAFLIGGKGRITAPIPWIAPYLEVGIGASLGSFETLTPFTNISDNGMNMHIPFSIGLEIGRKHNFDFGLTYYYQSSAKQFIGAVAFGLSFPINEN